jgi:hypothetical protein
MNDLFQKMFLGWVRHAMTGGAGFLFAHGLIQQSAEQILISAVLAIAGVAWSSISKAAEDYEKAQLQKLIDTPALKQFVPPGAAGKS